MCRYVRRRGGYADLTDVAGRVDDAMYMARSVSMDIVRALRVVRIVGGECVGMTDAAGRVGNVRPVYSARKRPVFVRGRVFRIARTRYVGMTDAVGRAAAVRPGVFVNRITV